MTLDKILNKAFKRYPRHNCIFFENKKIKYKHLEKSIDEFSLGLSEISVGKNSKVAVLLKNCPEYIISYFSILKNSAIVVPVNYMLKEEEIKYILEESKVETIISSSEYFPLLKRLKLRISCLNHIILIDKKLEQSLYYKDLLISTTHKVESCSKKDDVAIILYTSGTTGNPKGVMLTHNNLISNVKSCLKAVDITRKDRFICFLPMFHSFTWTVCVLIPLYLSGSITILESVMPFKKVVRAIFKRRVTIFAAIPPIYDALAKLKVPYILTNKFFRFLNPIKICISGAASLSEETLKNFESKFNVPLLEGYGLTEASPVVSMNPVDKRKIGSVGKPLPDIEVKVIDDKENSLPVNEKGELLVKGNNVMKGYYNQPSLTKETIKNSWLHTKDMANLDEEGYIYIVGRKSDLIIIKGQNIYPREIEEALYQHPKVLEAAVIGVKSSEKKDEVLKAFVVLKENAEIQKRELLDFLRSRIANYKVPKNIEFRKELPKSPTGKVLKKELK